MTPRPPLPGRILIPVANPATAEELIRIGAALLDPRTGELTALGIVEVPEEMPLSEGATKARQARRLAAFGLELRNRLVQRDHHMRGRGEAPLRGLFHVDVLVVQVHGERLAAPGAGIQHGFADEDKAHAGHAFQAFAAGRNQRVKAGGARVDLQRRKRTHGVHNQPDFKTLAHIGHGLQWIEHTGAGFAMDQHHMGDAAVLLQMDFQRLWVH